MTVHVNETPEWGHSLDDVAPELTPPHPDASALSVGTLRILEWLSVSGLRPTVEATWNHPPQATVRFGEGSGWLRGELTITGGPTGRATHMKVYWTGRDGKLRFDAVDGVRAIWTELQRHAEQRVERIRWLAERHGLTVAER